MIASLIGLIQFNGETFKSSALVYLRLKDIKNLKRDDES